MASIVLHRNAILLNKLGTKCLIGWKFPNLQFNHGNNLHTSRRLLTALKTGSCDDKLKSENETTKKPFDKLDLTFTDTKEAYKSKKTSELIRAYLVLKLSSFDFLVLNHEKVSSIKEIRMQQKF